MQTFAPGAWTPTGWTWLDWAIVAVLALSIAVAFLHGLLVEVCALAA
jgi:uncharacterized membrane protein required for colicin V production